MDSPGADEKAQWKEKFWAGRVKEQRERGR